MLWRPELGSAAASGHRGVLARGLRSLVRLGHDWYAYANRYVRPHVYRHGYAYGLGVLLCDSLIGPNVVGFAIFYGLVFAYLRSCGWFGGKPVDCAIFGHVVGGFPARWWAGRLPAGRAAGKRVG